MVTILPDNNFITPYLIMNLKGEKMFKDLNHEEIQNVNGGLVAELCAVFGVVSGIYYACYHLGYAQGQNAGYKNKYRQGCK